MAVTATIQLEGKDALATLAKLDKGLKQLGTDGEKSINKINTSFDVLKGVVGAQVIFKSLDLLKRGFLETADNALAFGKTLQEINSIAPRTAQETLVLKNALLGVSNEFGKDAQTQARAFYNIVSAGVQGTAKQLSVLETANKAAVAGLVDIDTSARVLVSSVNSYAASGLTAEQASDVLFNTVKAGITTFGELAGSIGSVAPLASAAGISFSELGGTLAFLTKNGLSTDEAATQLRATITSFIKPAAEAQQAAKELGIDFSTGAIRSKGFANVLKEVITATGGNEQALAKLFPNVRALSGVIAIAKGDFEDFQNILQSTADSAGATDAALQVITDSAAFQFEKLQNQIKNFGTSILTNFEEPIADALKLVNEFVSENGLELVGQGIDGIVSAFQTFNAVASTTGQFFNFISVAAAQANVTLASIEGGLEILGVVGGAALSALEIQFKTFLFTVNEARIAFNRLTGDTDEANLLQKSNDELARNISLLKESIVTSGDRISAISENTDKEVQERQKLADEIERLALEETAALQSEEQKRFQASQAFRDKVQQARIQAAADADKRRAEQAEADRAAAQAQLDQLAQVEQAKADLRTSFAEARAQEELERAEEEKIAKELAAEEDFLFLEENLGREATLRELNRIKNIDDEKKQTAEIKKLRDKARKEEQAGILSIRKFEDLTNKEKIAAQKSTLSTIASLSNSNNSTLFAIGKAASLALAGINVAEGVTKALAAFPPPFNFAAAAAVGAAGAVQIAQIASSKPPSAGSFQSGGIVEGPSQTGDQLTANVNGGEAIFNRRQQQNLFNAVNSGDLGGGSNISINIESAMGDVPQETIDSLIDQINDRTEFGNKKLGGVG